MKANSSSLVVSSFTPMAAAPACRVGMQGRCETWHFHPIWRARDGAVGRAERLEGVRIFVDGVEEIVQARGLCSRAEGSRPIANGVRAISGQDGTWRRCEGPAQHRRRGSAWR